MRSPLIIIILAFSLLQASGEEAVIDFIQEHCIKCHGPDEQKGDFRMDDLADPSDATADDWFLIADLIESGEMPPRKEARPTKADQQLMINWISKKLSTTVAVKPSLRRMNRTEFAYTLQDLLGVETDLAHLLPPDSSTQGFDNVSDGLGISAVHLESYLEAANEVFDSMIRRVRPAPAQLKKIYPAQYEKNAQIIRAKWTAYAIQKGNAFVDLTYDYPSTRVDPINPTENGVYRFRAAVFPHKPNDPNRTITVGVYSGPQYTPGEHVLQGVYDVTGSLNDPKIIEFTAKLNVDDTFHIVPWIYPNHVEARDGYSNHPGVGVIWAECFGPIDQEFPTESLKRLSNQSPTVSMVPQESIYMKYRKGMRKNYVSSGAPEKDLEQIVRNFANRAIRRPMDKSVIDQFVNLSLSLYRGGTSFEESLRGGLSSVLCSPHFLLHNTSTEVDNYSIASRMSYFLWSSTPDQELIDLAKSGQLSNAGVRKQQIERMLNDPKIERFIENFTGQWLNLHDIKFTTPDKNLFPEYDDVLLYSMLEETHGFFHHILKNDLSVRNFIDSDFAYLNERMAQHYGISGIKGNESFRIVDLPEDSIRGGLLAQASILKVTANGTGTSPVLRGVWVLDKILGQPPSPPPSGIPAVEPDIRGANNIREELVKHREDESCSRCHSRIDPPGFALEEFNAIGLHRTKYRSLGEGQPVSFVETYKLGQPVFSGEVWQDGTPFSSFKEFRAQLLQKDETVARALAKKLLIYGTGRAITQTDNATVDAVVAKSKENDFGLRSMIHAVIESDLFFQP